MKVWLDDLRPAPDGWTHCRWPNEVIAHVRSGQVEVLSLDHDLGDDTQGTGYDVVLFLEQYAAEGGKLPEEIYVHSQNPVGVKKMVMGIESARRLEGTFVPNAIIAIAPIVNEKVLQQLRNCYPPKELQ